MLRHIALASGVFLMATASLAVPAGSDSEWQQNWPQWRGPLATGVAPLGDPPTTWDDNTNIRWKVAIPGRGNATPIVWGDQIFLTTAVKTDRTVELEEPPAEAPKGKMRFNIQRPKNYYQFVVLCVDRRTGGIRWQRIAKEEVPHEGHHPDGSFASASPATDGKRLYVSFGSRGVYGFDMDGKELWSRDLGRMKISNTFGEGCSPVVHGDVVVVNWDHQAGSFIICLDAATGETRWKVDRDENTTWATPLLVEYGGRTQVIVHGAKRVRGYDLKTGELIWACGGQAINAIPCPVSDGNLVFAMTGFMGNALYAIPLDLKGDITTEADKVAWKRKQPGTPYVPSPLLYGDLLYFTAGNKGILSCINAKTGEPVIDRQRLQGIENIYASPVGAADRVYLVGRDGTTVVIQRPTPQPLAKTAADTTTTEKDQPKEDQDQPKAVILATNKLSDHFDASPIVVGREIILRGEEHLYNIATP